MKKNVWLITHDGYIDRRIFFFADVFRAQGWKVKLFPFFYFELDQDVDPFYVERPIEKKLVKKYSYKIDECENREKRELFEKIIYEQKQYFAKNGKYTDQLKKLNIRLKSVREVKLRDYGNSYSVTIRNDGKEINYFSAVDSFQISCDKECIEYEKAIYKSYKEGTVKDVGRYSLCDGIQVRCTRNEWGDKIFEAHKPGMSFSYEYDVKENCLYRCDIVKFDYYTKDIVQGKEFDFIDFKQILFDYSCVLERVKQELETEQPDMVYVADLPTLPIGVMLKKVTGCDLMVDCHEWWFQQTKLWEGHLQSKVDLAERYEKELYKDCDICITVGKLLAKDMGKYYGQKFHTIYSCMSKELDGKYDEKDEAFWENKYNIPAGSKIAIFQGGMTTLRNLDNLARATKYLQEGQYLVIVGDGAYRSEFEKILDEEGKRSRVVFAGWVKQTELNQYSANADVGVIPYHALSEYYAYSVPNKLMEFCETQTPVLYDNSMKEIGNVVKSKGNGVGIGADLSDPKEFGTVLAEMLEDKKLLKELRESYKASKNEFSYSAQKDNLEIILNEYYQHKGE